MNVRIITTSRALIVNNKNELLLVKNSKDEPWFTPGGWLDGFETLEEACVREVKEETGIEVKPEKLFKIDYYRLTKEENTKWNENINKIEHYFICTIASGDIKSDANNTNLWIDKDAGNTGFIKFFNKEELMGAEVNPKWIKDLFPFSL
jgi:8-oxo-dGTP pyrophosphatase MutT (NUDIX family)